MASVVSPGDSGDGIGSIADVIGERVTQRAIHTFVNRNQLPLLTEDWVFIGVDSELFSREPWRELLLRRVLCGRFV